VSVSNTYPYRCHRVSVVSDIHVGVHASYVFVCNIFVFDSIKTNIFVFDIYVGFYTKRKIHTGKMISSEF
jgi:hypothetical protein